MVKLARLLVVSCVLGVLSVLSVPKADALQPRVAVLELKGQLSRGQLSVLSDKVRSGVLRGLQGKDYVVMSRENMAMLLKDMGLDCESVQGECEVETGRNIGAAYVVSGSVEDVGGGLLLVSLKVHETQSGALKATGDVRGKEVIQLIDQLPSTVSQLIQRAFGGGGGGVPMAPVIAPVAPNAPAQAQFNLNFGGGGGLGVQAKLKEQECIREAEQKGSAGRMRRLSDAIAQAKSQASRAWQAQASELEMCTKLEKDQRYSCISAVEQWLGVARSMTVDLPAGVETVQTACGARQPAYQKETRTVAALEVSQAESLLTRLKAFRPGMSGGKNSLGMDFVAISPGSFMMGSPSNESGRNTDEKQHRVTLTKGFLLQTTEVTQGQWRALMRSNPSDAPSCGSNCPVEKVSWMSVAKYANALSRKEGLTEAYRISGSSVSWNQNANGYRLPTEAEWEYAARAGERTRYSGSNSLNTVSWTKTNSSGKVRPVATKQANAWGLYDMSGNVWEWVWDWKRTYSGTVIDPTGNRSGSKRVFRGGSAVASSHYSRCAHRLAHAPTSKYRDLGFRLARTTY